MTDVNRRTFIKEAALLSAGITSIVQAEASGRRTEGKAVTVKSEMPHRTIRDREISRLIMGGNPFSSNAHAEPLVYSRELFKHYFSHDKIVETLIIGVEHGIDTFLGRIDNNVIGFLKQYEKSTGEMIPWIAQSSAKPHRGAQKQDILDNIMLAVDNGAMGVYFHGESADYLFQEGRLDEIPGYIDHIRAQGCIAGVGAHRIQTIEACEKINLKPDFYMKTLNSHGYCCPDYELSVQYMAKVAAPWIAFKVLAAGRMKPQEGFAAAIKAGADFLCVGMFDFQVQRNVELIRPMLLS